MKIPLNTSHPLMTLVVAVGIVLMACSLLQARDAGNHLLKSADIKWSDGPPSLPRGAQIAVIEGDLTKAEPITFRLRFPANYIIAPHTHPTVEHVTVLSGTFHMGPGDQVVREKATALNSGSFAVFQPGHSMFAWTDEETVVQVHSVGPWGITYINPADDPRKK